MPRDRAGTFEPQQVSGQLDGNILVPYVRGMSTRDIEFGDGLYEETNHEGHRRRRPARSWTKGVNDKGA